MILSNPNLELLRTRPQSTKLYLSIFQPRVVFQAQVNDVSIARGARAITFDTVSFGSYLAIESGFTLLIGSVPGAKDVGKIRVRSATSSVITVSENSNIAWGDNLYLTVLRYVELWPVFPRIILNPANESDSIFYKDYDIPYSNQNSILGTFANAGPHRAAHISTGSVALWYSSTGTYNLLGDSLSYEWAFEGGTPTGSVSANPGFVSYNTPGHYVTRLTISGSSGGIDTTYRYVSIYNNANPSILKWEMNSLSGSRDEGGYQASFKVYETIPLDENSVIVVFSDDWYGSTHTSLGGNYPNAESIFFTGYILKDSIRYNYKDSYVEFSVGSITELMKQSLGFSVSVESKASPSKWYELLDMDGRRALYHYLRWHTTALSLADFQFVGSDYKIQFFDADRESMYDALDNFMRNTLIGQTVSDRQGKVWMEVEARAYSNPTGTFTPVMQITKRDWMGEPSIEESLSDSLSYVEYGGIAYSGVSTGTFSALLGSAPGNAPSFRGKVETHEGLALLGQAQLNAMVGNIFANENTRIPKVSMEMDIGARNLDIAPQETTQMTILASDTVRNRAVDGLYIPDSMDWRYDSRKQILLPNVDFKNLVNGIAGETVSIPISPTEAGFDAGGFSVPQLQVPPLPLQTIPSSFLSTGSSCCDYLASFGVGLGVYSCLYIRTEPTPPFTLGAGDGFGGVPRGWEFASNPSMYNADTGNMPFINTGTATYVLQFSGDWVVTQDDLPSILLGVGFEIDLYDNTGVLLDTVISYSVHSQGSPSEFVAIGGTTPGNNGHFSVSASFSANGKKPNYMHAVSRASATGAHYQVAFSNLRLEVTGTST